MSNTTSPAVPMVDPGEYAHSKEGVDQSEALAGSIMDSFLSTVEIARLDHTITASFLLIELFSVLDVYGGVDMNTVISSIKRLVDQRTAVLRAAATGELTEDDVADPVPSHVPAVPTGRTLH